MKINVKPILITALTLALSTGQSARAGFAPDFQGISAVGPNTSFNYSLAFGTLSAEERLDAGTSVITPGVIGTQDFITIFDVPGFVSATAPASFSVQTQLVGVAGPFQSPTDNPALTNVTFRYTGADISVDTAFTGMSIVSTFGATGLGVYSSQRTDNDGFDIDTKIGETGYTAIPAVPEPAAATLLGIAALGLLRRRTRR